MGKLVAIRGIMAGFLDTLIVIMVALQRSYGRCGWPLGAIVKGCQYETIVIVIIRELCFFMGTVTINMEKLACSVIGLLWPVICI